MKKIEMVVSGKRALVDEDQVKKVAKKQELVALALNLQKQIDKNDPFNPNNVKLREVTSKIIRLNRTIRQNIIFIQN